MIVFVSQFHQSFYIFCSSHGRNRVKVRSFASTGIANDLRAMKSNGQNIRATSLTNENHRYRN